MICSVLLRNALREDSREESWTYASSLASRF